MKEIFLRWKCGHSMRGLLLVGFKLAFMPIVSLIDRDVMINSFIMIIHSHAQSLFGRFLTYDEFI